MESKVKIFSPTNALVILYKKVWWKRSPIKKRYYFTGKRNKVTGRLLFNGYTENIDAELTLMQEMLWNQLD